MLVVAVSTRGGLPDLGTPRVLFQGRFVSRGNNSDSVAPDGRFLMLQLVSEPKPRVTLDVITNWFGELSRLTASK